MAGAAPVRNRGKLVLADRAGPGHDGAMRDVLIAVFEGVQSLDVTGPLEVFTGANAWRVGAGAPPTA